MKSLAEPIPEGFTYLGGVKLDLGGGGLLHPATLSIDQDALASSCDASDTVIVVKATTVAGIASYTACDLGVLDSQTGRLQTAQAGSPWLMVTGEGRYVFLKETGPMGLVDGRALTPSSSPIPDAVVGIAPAEGASNPSPTAFGKRVESLVQSGKAPQAALVVLDLAGITSVTGADGRYVVPAPLSSVTLRAVNILTADVGEAQAAPTEASPNVTKDIVITPAPMAVTSTYPVDGAANVPTGGEIDVTFSKLVDPASLTEGSIEVTAAGETIPGALRIVSGGHTVVFTPDVFYPAGVEVSVDVTSVTDRSGTPLEAPYAFGFTTHSAVDQRLDPGKIEANLPDADGNICVEGGPGAVDSSATVTLFNTTHPEYGTVTVTAGTDGSFGGSCTLHIKGDAGDIIQIMITGFDGAERVYTFDHLVSADHRTVSMGPDGGSYTFPATGTTPPVTMQVPPGAFDGPATISVTDGDTAQSAPVPDGFTAGPPVKVTLSSPAKKEIAVIFHAPQDWNLNDSTKQFWLVKTVTWGPDSTKSPMVADVLRPTACAGDTAGNCLVTQSPPFTGLTESGEYQLYQAGASWGFVSGVMDAVSGNPVVMFTSASPFVGIPSSGRYVVAVPPATSTFTLTAEDVYTGEIVMQDTFDDVVIDPGTPVDIGVSTDDHTPPFPLQSTLFTVKAIQINSLSEDVDQTLHYEADDTNGDGRADGAVHIKGLAGCGSPDQPVTIMNLMNGETASGTTDNGGAFPELSVPLQMSGTIRDIIIVTIGQSLIEPQALLQVTLSRHISLDEQTMVVEKQSDDGTYTPVDGTPVFVAGSDNKVMRFDCGSVWEEGKTYRVTFPHLVDEAGDPCPPGLQSYFKVRKSQQTGSDSGYGMVRSMARLGSLLFVAAPVTDNGASVNGISVLDVSIPSQPTRVGFIQTNQLVRGLSVTSIPAPVQGSCPETDSSTLLPVLVAVGGGEGPRGTIEEYEILNEAPYLQWMGSNGLSCSLSEWDCTDSDGDPYAGVPFALQTFGQFAFISTIGVGVQGVDLTTLCQTTTEPQCFKGEPRTEKLGLRVRSLARIDHPRTDNEAGEHTLFLAVAGEDLRVLDASSTLAVQQSAVGYRGYNSVNHSGGFGSGRLGMAVAERWPTFRRNETGELETCGPRDLLFAADGTRGVAVFDVTNRTAPRFLSAFTLVKPGASEQPDPASDVSLDPVNRVLYVSGSRGLWIYDISHLELSSRSDGVVEISGGMKFIGLDESFSGPGAPQVDADTGLAYSSSGDTVAAYQMRAPKIAFVTEKTAARTLTTRGATALDLEEADGVAALDEIDNNSPRIAAFVPGGAGNTLAVDVLSLTRGGNIRKAPAGNNPPTQLAGEGLRDDHKDQALILTRQSDDIRDPKFNLYLSDPIIATYNMNKDVGANPAPLILAADSAVARLSLDNPINQGLTWLDQDQRLAARTISPYLGIDFVDTDGNSLPAIDAMSLALYQKAQYKAAGNILGTVSISNPVGVKLEIPNGLSESSVDEVTATITDHQDPTYSESVTLTETGVNTLVFSVNGPDGTPRIQLAILTTDDPDVPPVVPVFSQTIPDNLMVSTTGNYGPDNEPFATDQGLIETGADTKVFQEEVVEAHLTLGDRDLPPSQAGNITGTIRNLAGDTMAVTLQETAPGSRVFTSTDQDVEFHCLDILDDEDQRQAAPKPNSLDALYGTISVSSWGVNARSVFLIEEGVDSPNYGNSVETTHTSINHDFGEEPFVSLDDIQTQYIPRKKFYIEVRDPSLAEPARINVNYTRYDGQVASETLDLVKVDSLRYRTKLPLVGFSGNDFHPVQSAADMATKKPREETAGEAPVVEGAWGRRFEKLASNIQDTYNRTLIGNAASIKYVAIGDSITAGVMAGQQVYYNQVLAYPKRLADMLGIPMVLPLFDYPGMPSHRKPVAADRMFKITMPRSPKGPRRLQPNEFLQDLGVSGADIYMTVKDKEPICGSKETLFLGGDLETARIAAMTDFLPYTNNLEEHSPVEWLGKMPVLPSLLTIWIGANDALGVAINGEVVEDPGTVLDPLPCEVACTEGKNGQKARNLTSEAAFEKYYKAMLARIVTIYSDKKTADPETYVDPILLFGLVPDVTIPPVTAPLQPVSDNPAISQPFAGSGFRIRINGRDYTEEFRNARFSLSSVTSAHDRLSLLSVAKPVLGIPVLRRAYIKKVFGMGGNPHALSENEPCEKPPEGTLRVLTAADVKKTSDRIKAFNKSILKLLYVDRFTDAGLDADALALLKKWRSEKRIHVLDTHWILDELYFDTYYANLPHPPTMDNHDSLVQLALEAGVSGEMMAVVNEDWKFLYGAAAPVVYPIDPKKDGEYRKVFAPYKSGLFADGQGGLFGPDYIHPTRTAHACVANAFLDLLKKIAQDVPGAAVGPRFTDADSLKIPAEQLADPWRDIQNRAGGGSTP